MGTENGLWVVLSVAMDLINDLSKMNSDGIQSSEQNLNMPE
jgi:hypothetical protein